ncbi:universal stress protein [Legionella drancourtii]|uniref:Universal stress protein n=1 Tax=Legionella drancourtii LLAP12 TaxID=658187 RepID=G9ERP6_9GAMM|nr:universal stress protein [Legionella drancourtii]EHL30059.1 hypothetical protein LDG_7964 [Legionella drancourtii LLAP12]
MYKRILVSVDGSDESKCALQEAVKLAKVEPTHLLIIHVLEENFMYHTGPGFDYNALIVAMRAEGERILDAAKKIASSNSSINVEIKLIELQSFQGRIAEVIVDEAKDWAADLIVLGTHGRRGVSRFFLGSVAENTVRIATTPVLLVKSDNS